MPRACTSRAHGAPPHTPNTRVRPPKHPYLEERVGAPHVCSAKLSNVPAVVACAAAAVAAEVPPLIPAELTEEAYDARLEAIFGPFLPLQSSLL